MEEPDQALSAEKVRTVADQPQGGDAGGSSLQTTDEFNTRAAKADTPDDVRKLTEEFFARKPQATPEDLLPEEKPEATEAEKTEGAEKEAGSDAATEKATEPEAKADAQEEDKADEATTEEAPEGESQSKQWRVRVQSTDKVGQEAFRISKRNQDLTMDECMARARESLGIKPPVEAKGEKTEKGGDEAGKPGSTMPDSIDSTNARIAELRDLRTKALTEEIDFAKADTLDRQIDDLKEHRFTLRDQVKVDAKTASDTYDAEFEKSRVKAIENYDFVGDLKSPAAIRMLEIDAQLEKSGSALFYSPEKPFILAEMAARELRIAPKSGVKPAATPQRQIEKKPSVVASGAQRTVTQSTQQGQQLAAIQSLKTPQDLEAHLRKLGISMV